MLIYSGTIMSIPIKIFALRLSTMWISRGASIVVEFLLGRYRGVITYSVVLYILDLSLRTIIGLTIVFIARLGYLNIRNARSINVTE